MTDHEHIAMLVTAPDAATAETIATALVEERLVACVNVQAGITSYYRWEGKVEKDEEHLLIIKTRRDMFTAVETRVTDLHPYDVPEVIALPINMGSRKYLDWIDDSTKKG